MTPNVSTINNQSPLNNPPILTVPAVSDDLRDNPPKPLPNIRDVKGLINIFSAAPTKPPKTFWNSIGIYSTYLYVFNQKTQTWMKFQSV